MAYGPLGGIKLYTNLLALRKKTSILRYAVVFWCAFTLVPIARSPDH